MVKSRILVVDDEEAVRFGFRTFLETEGFEIEEAGDCRATEEVFRASRPDVAVMNQYLPDGNALDLLPKLKAIDPQVPVIILTGYGSIDMAVRTIKEGAENFVTKPVDLSTRLVILQRLLESPRNRQKELAGKTRQARVHIDPFVGTSAAVPPNV
ncbi:MAG: hypothetical protein DMG05_29820 [Acidobacteria bacterium]|nr:MAG: hypothetical protein DMG05_29820 [Acidobacteriota bacterium]